MYLTAPTLASKRVRCDVLTSASHNCPRTDRAMNLRRTCTAGIAVVFMALNSAAAQSAEQEQPYFSTTPLFIAGHADYSAYRIPAIAVTPTGTVLAAAAGRYDSVSDWANADIMLRRSADCGLTWDDQQVLVNDGTNTVDNPTFIVDEMHGTVHLMYQINYARAYLKTSRDDGATWSPPREITYVFDQFRERDNYAWQVIAMGPGHGIVLRTGRIVVPVWLAAERRHRPSISATIYSDDHGQNWRAGDIIIHTTDETPNPSEHQLVELADGRVLANLRTESRRHRRVIALSPDGVTGWSIPQFVDDLYEPVCMGSVARLSSDNGSMQTALLFSNPNSGHRPDSAEMEGSRERSMLTVRLSADGGQSWPLSRVIEPGASAYSDIAVGPDGVTFVLYESAHGDKPGPYGCIKLARFNKAWLMNEAP